MGIIYRPVRQNMTPNNVTIITNEDNTFSLIIDGVTCVAYRFSIYDSIDTRLTPPSTSRVEITTLNNGEELDIVVDSNTFDSGETYKWQVDVYGNDILVDSIDISTDIITTSLVHNLKTGDEVYIQSDTTLPNGTVEFTRYYIRKLSSTTLALYNTSEASRSDGSKVSLTSVGSGIITLSNIAISEQIPFTVYSEPTLTLTSSTISSQSTTFNPIYVHSEGVPIEKFDITITDQFGTVLQSSTDNYTSNLEVIIDGLINENEVNVEYTATNKVGQIVSTGVVNFQISYTSSQANITPSITNLSNESAILLSWAGINTSVGSISGGTYSYIDDFITTGNTGLQLDLNTIMETTGLDIDASNTFSIIWQPSDYTTFDGAIFKLSNSVTGNSIEIGYDLSLGRFYRNVNESSTKIYSAPKALEVDVVYLLALTPTNLYTIDFYSPTISFMSFAGLSWEEMTSSWEEII